MTTPIATITVPMPVDARLWLDLHKTVIDWHRRECREIGCHVSMHGAEGVTVLAHGVPEQPAPPKEVPARRRSR